MLVLGGCVQALPPPVRMSIGAAVPADWPAPRYSAISAPAAIEALHFSALDPQIGTDWDGDVVTTTNTASVEVGSNLFDVSIPRPAPGRFHFHFRLIDIPALMVRPYSLRVIARNTAGVRTEVDVPFRFRARSIATAARADARSGDPLGAPPLVDMNGNAVDLTHGVAIVSFIYTRCPDPRMCPLVTSKFGRMSQLLRDAPVRLLEVTLDPGFDTPAVLRRYGRAAGADGTQWTLATGEPAAIAAFAERAGLYVDRPRPGLVLHSETVLIVRDGVLEENLAGNDWTPDELAAEARAVAALPGNPFERFALRLFAGAVEVCGAALSRGPSPASLVGAVALLGLVALVLLWRRRIRILFTLFAGRLAWGRPRQ